MEGIVAVCISSCYDGCRHDQSQSHQFKLQYFLGSIFGDAIYSHSSEKEISAEPEITWSFAFCCLWKVSTHWYQSHSTYKTFRKKGTLFWLLSCTLFSSFISAVRAHGSSNLASNKKLRNWLGPNQLISGALPSPRQGHQVMSAQSKFYVFGGRNIAGGSRPVLLKLLHLFLIHVFS